MTITTDTQHSEADERQEIMPKQVSALNTYLLVQYLEEHYQELNLEQILQEITQNIPSKIQNLQTGSIEEVTLDHLRSTRYWFSHQLVKSFHDKISEFVPDPRLGYRIGALLYKTQPLIRTAVLIPFLGPSRVAKRVAIESSKFNRTKTYTLLTLESNRAVIRITHAPDIDTCDFTMQWNAGCMASFARLAGATEASTEMSCIDPGTERGGSIWDFELFFSSPPLPTRLMRGLLFSLPWVRRIIDRAEMIEGEHIQQILDRDNIIKERTDHLVSIQHQLIEQERRSIEQKLRLMSKELVATEERERKAIAEDLHDSVTQLLAVSLNKIKRNSDVQQNGELSEVQEHLENALSDLRSLTFQISPPVLYDFGLEAALEWLVEDINQHHAMDLIFSNLLEEPIYPTHQEKVVLYRAVRELVINMMKHANTDSGQVILRSEANTVIIEVSDDGVGFDLNTVNRGFGLYSLEDRLAMLNGHIEIISNPGEGTIALLSVPLDCTLPERGDGTHGAKGRELPN